MWVLAAFYGLLIGLVELVWTRGWVVRRALARYPDRDNIDVSALHEHIAPGWGPDWRVDAPSRTRAGAGFGGTTTVRDGPPDEGS